MVLYTSTFLLLLSSFLQLILLEPCQSLYDSAESDLFRELFNPVAMINRTLSADKKELEKHHNGITADNSFLSQCHTDLLLLLVSLKNAGKQPDKILTNWAVETFDAFGKPGSGIVHGNLYWLGGYSDCLKINSRSQNFNITIPIPHFIDLNLTFHGHYEGSYLQAVVHLNQSQSFPIPGAELLGQLVWGLCLPKSCSFSQVDATLRKWFNSPTAASLGASYVKTRIPVNKALPFDPLAITAMFILFIFILKFCAVYISLANENLLSWDEYKIHKIVCSVFILLNLIGSIVDFYDLPKPHLGIQAAHDSVTDVANNTNSSEESSDNNTTLNELEAVALDGIGNARPLGQSVLKIMKSGVLCFSLISNGRKLLGGGRDSAERDQKVIAHSFEINAIHGIRFLSMAWIILGQTYYFSVPIVDNALSLIDPNKHGITFLTIIQAMYGAETFLLLSGMLSALTFFRMIEFKPIRLSSFKFWLAFLGHRLLRLTPLYALVMLMYLGLTKYFGTGPLWPKDGFEVNYCADTWWTNLLYINNLVSIYRKLPDGTKHRQFCMNWTWYSACEMQYFLISPIVLIPLAKSLTATEGVYFRLTSSRAWKLMGFLVLGLICIISASASAIVSALDHFPPNLFPPKTK